MKKKMRTLPNEGLSALRHIQDENRQADQGRREQSSMREKIDKVKGKENDPTN